MAETEYEEFFNMLRNFIIENRTNDIIEITFKYKIEGGQTEEYTFKENIEVKE